MSKEDLIRNYQEYQDTSYEAARREVKGFLETISQMLLRGEMVYLNPVGTIRVEPTPERKARDPRNGEEIHVKAGRKLMFTTFPGFREKLKQ